MSSSLKRSNSTASSAAEEPPLKRVDKDHVVEEGHGEESGGHVATEMTATEVATPEELEKADVVGDLSSTTRPAEANNPGPTDSEMQVEKLEDSVESKLTHDHDETTGLENGPELQVKESGNPAEPNLDNSDMAEAAESCKSEPSTTHTPETHTPEPMTPETEVEESEDPDELEQELDSDIPEVCRSQPYSGPKSQRTQLALGLPPLHKLEDIYKSLTARAIDLKLDDFLSHLGSRPFRVVTMCSGTESPLLALEMVQQSKCS